MMAAAEPSWKSEELYADIVDARNCCAAYSDFVTREGTYDGYEITPEVVLEAPILDGKAILIGKVDLQLRRKSDGWLCTDDFKTASVHNRSSLPPLLEKSYQHYVYQILMGLMHP